ncbi:MAG: hypothetical protein ACOYL5_10885 [Phototrophicaceae bacterium]
MNRRGFLQHIGALALGGMWGQFMPPLDYAVYLPPFVTPLITPADVDYLNTTIVDAFSAHAGSFPQLPFVPQFIVVNTLPEVLAANGSALIARKLIRAETLTLAQVQTLLVTTRFGSVSTPHRGAALKHFGRFIYIKQHPQRGYRPPAFLLLEEMLHCQQDRTIMRTIITREGLNPVTCLHSELKGISELGAHILIEPLRGEPDYVFVLDDGTHAASAADAVNRLAARFGVTDDDMTQALLYDERTYSALDAIAVGEYGKPLWQMVTTWRFARDAAGNPTDLAPAFQPFTLPSSVIRRGGNGKSV